MRVLFLTHGFPAREGDVPGSFVLRLARALVEAGVSVGVLAPAAPGVPKCYTVGQVRVERFRYAPAAWEVLVHSGAMVETAARGPAGAVAALGLLAAGTSAVIRAVDSMRPDVVHAHWLFPAGFTVWAAGPLVGVPLVTTVHGTDARLARRSRAAAWAARRVLRRSARVTAVSSWLASELRAVDPRASPIVSPMPVETELFMAGATRSSDRILFVGRFTEQKGLAHAIRALALMGAPATLDVIAGGRGRPAYERLARELGALERITFHGAVPHHALPAMYRAAAALVMPSVDEGLGLVAAEAALSETPVVAFDSGGVRDIVRDGESGVLVPAGNDEALAAALDRVLGDRAWAAALGRQARTAALGRFAPDVVARQYQAIYREAIHLRGNARSDNRHTSASAT